MDKLTLEDLDGGHRELAEVVGLDTFRQLVNYAGGSQIGIPTKKWLLADIRNRQIMREYTGYNVREIAVKYELADSTVYDIIREGRQKQVEAQESLF